jgi:hypothetical protein
MTLEQFQASRQLVADIGAVTDTEQLDGRPGYLYADTLWIETHCPEWSGSPADAYQFLLVIGNQEWLSNDLSELEPILYEYAVDEGFVQ